MNPVIQATELSIRLQFPKFSKGFNLNFLQSFITRHEVGPDNVASMGQLGYPNQFYIVFKQKCNDIRERLLRIYKTKIKGRSLWILPFSESEVRGFIHWLPSTVGNDAVGTILGNYGDVISVEGRNEGNRNIPFPKSSRYFILMLKAGVNVDDISTFIEVEGHQGWVVIQGRKSLVCFYCKEEGHWKSSCPVYEEKFANVPRPECRKRSRGRRHKKKKVRITDASDSWNT